MCLARDSANSASAGVQITNKCATLLNGPLAIIATWDAGLFP